MTTQDQLNALLGKLIEDNRSLDANVAAREAKIQELQSAINALRAEIEQHRGAIQYNQHLHKQLTEQYKTLVEGVATTPAS